MVYHCRSKVRNNMDSLLENAIMCKVSGNAADRRRLLVKYTT